MADFSKYDALKEKALSNVLRLFDFWHLEYKQISATEYDFINPTRIDKQYGACRFNIEKGRGADFANNISFEEIKKINKHFTKDDFQNYGFDIIGLCQRINKCNSYKEAAKTLKKQLSELNKVEKLVKPNPNAAEERKLKVLQKNQKSLVYADRTWAMCSEVKNSLGEVYLNSRSIVLDHEEPNMKFHPKVMNKELGKPIPTLIFRLQRDIDGPLMAMHRIYLKNDGTGKAEVPNPKMALGIIKGYGIWFGSPDETLYILEGPENALTIRSLGFKFVVCTVSAPNMPNIEIPEYVRRIIIMPDPDQAGKANAAKLIKILGSSDKKREIKLSFPTKKILKNGKLADWNDLIHKAE